MPSFATDPAAQANMTEADFDELGALLAADWAPETTMDLEQLDGFLAGVICAPRAVLPSAGCRPFSAASRPSSRTPGRQRASST
jgi:hypothetical protein